MAKIIHFSRKKAIFLCERLWIIWKLDKYGLEMSYFMPEWRVKMKKPEKYTLNQSTYAFFSASFAKIPIFPILKRKFEKSPLKQVLRTGKRPLPSQFDLSFPQLG